MVQGSCCCGAVQFTLDQNPSMLGTCHCSRCRKVGASHIAFVERAHFTLTAGEDAIAEYQPEASYKYTRCFCRKCGSALGEMTSPEKSFPINANLIDGALGVENRFHEFVSEKPDWLKIGDEAQQFEGHPTPSE